MSPEATGRIGAGTPSLIRIGEEEGERAEIRESDRIDDVVGRGCGELNQADALSVGVQAVGFGIDGDDRTLGEVADQPAEARFISDENGRW